MDMPADAENDAQRLQRLVKGYKGQAHILQPLPSEVAQLQAYVVADRERARRQAGPDLIIEGRLAD